MKVRVACSAINATKSVGHCDQPIFSHAYPRRNEIAGLYRRPATKRVGVALACYALPLLLAWHANTARAEPISIALTARVTEVVDTDNVLGGAVHIGDMISGSFIYEASRPDQTPDDPAEGSYQCFDLPCGFSVTAGGFEFRSSTIPFDGTTPNDINLSYGVANNWGDPPQDIYGVGSLNNVFPFVLPDDATKSLAWSLIDPTATALESDSMPTIPPVLADWTQPPGQGLLVGSVYTTDAPPGQFPPKIVHVMTIRAEVTSAVLGNQNNGDSDGDGIDDTVDTGNGTFADAGVPQTTGSIVDTGGLLIHVQDAGNPTNGVTISTASGPGIAELRVCGQPVLLRAGVSATVTCGSITVEVTQGSVTVGLYGNAGSVEVPAGTTVKISQNPDGTSRVENLGGSAVTVTTGGGTTTLGGGETLIAGTQFQGFFAPVDMNGVLNSAKAGSAVPLKWRLTRIEDGQPVTDLQSAKVRVTGLDCALGTSIDQVEELAAGNSGLQNLGDGYYQFNWKTPKSYAQSCKTLHLDLGEGSADQTALFSFPK